MTTPTALENFCENLFQDVRLYAESEDEPQMLHDAFTQMAFDILADGELFEDPQVCYAQARGMEISGYELDTTEGRLNLFLSIHNNSNVPVTVGRQQIETGYKRLRTFLMWCSEGMFKDLEPSSPIFDMALGIYNARDKFNQIRTCIVTDGKATIKDLPSESFGDVQITKRVYDLEDLHRLSTSGQDLGEISIDFEKRFGKPLPCLPVDSSGNSYKGFVLLIPGHILREIYSEFGPRLLQRNVRSFLQARGKVNRGIRDTILNEPDKFLAYNNGITLTAQAVHMKNGGIQSMDGIQIVNGGQTTASLLAARNGKADLSDVFVAAKLIEIDGTDHDELLRNVSRYSNTQNRVQEADFSANDPFHIGLEQLSRTSWAPPADGANGHTKWFYERARGQYQDARVSSGTPAGRRKFGLENPSRQRFSKTDVAKFEQTWDQLPHRVSLGAQKNFSDFMIRLARRDQSQADKVYYEKLIAKAILFKQSERIVQRQSFGGYRANIVTYTLAFLSHATSQRIDLGRIWRNQAITESMEETIARISHEVFRIITNPPTTGNITEWCKRLKCWEQVRDQLSQADALSDIGSELIGGDQVKEGQIEELSNISKDYKDNLMRVLEVSSESWLLVARWALETDALDGRQRQLALKMARAVKRGSEISESDAEAAVVIIETATHLGFPPSAA